MFVNDNDNSCTSNNSTGKAGYQHNDCYEPSSSSSSSSSWLSFYTRNSLTRYESIVLQQRDQAQEEENIISSSTNNDSSLSPASLQSPKKKNALAIQRMMNRVNLRNHFLAQSYCYESQQKKNQIADTHMSLNSCKIENGLKNNASVTSHDLSFNNNDKNEVLLSHLLHNDYIHDEEFNLLDIEWNAPTQKESSNDDGKMPNNLDVDGTTIADDFFRCYPHCAQHTASPVNSNHRGNNSRSFSSVSAAQNGTATVDYISTSQTQTPHNKHQLNNEVVEKNKKGNMVKKGKKPDCIIVDVLKDNVAAFSNVDNSTTVVGIENERNQHQKIITKSNRVIDIDCNNNIIGGDCANNMNSNNNNKINFVTNAKERDTLSEVGRSISTVSNPYKQQQQPSPSHSSLPSSSPLKVVKSRNATLENPYNQHQNQHLSPPHTSRLSNNTDSVYLTNNNSYQQQQQQQHSSRISKYSKNDSSAVPKHNASYDERNKNYAISVPSQKFSSSSNHLQSQQSEQQPPKNAFVTARELVKQSSKNQKSNNNNNNYISIEEKDEYEDDWDQLNRNSNGSNRNDSYINRNSNNSHVNKWCQEPRHHQQQANPYQQQNHHQHSSHGSPSFPYHLQNDGYRTNTTNNNEPPPNHLNSYNNNYNPHGTTVNNAPQQHSQHQTLSSPQNISAGLKRKFQVPVRGSSNNNASDSKKSKALKRSKNGVRGNNDHNSNSNTNTNLIKKSFQGNNSNKNSSSNNDDSDDDEEEELPEALQGLDPELIQKIKNEIIESQSSTPITFDDIAGLANAKQTVLELVCWPMKRPDLFTGLRRGPNGLLLFGPPGTGKTLIGKAIAHESGATFFSISSSSLTSKWIGEGEKLVRTLFAVAAVEEPSVVFIDEIDSLLTKRKSDDNEASRRIKTEFLVQLDGTGSNGDARVLVIGATNRPQELDDAARRRFVKRLYIPLPVTSDREILLNTLLAKNHHSLTKREIAKLSSAGMTDGFSGADLKSLCTDAALGPIRALGSRALDIKAEDVPPISYKHFRMALKGMCPSVAQEDLGAYEEWNGTYGTKNVGERDDDDDSDNNDGLSLTEESDDEEENT